MRACVFDLDGTLVNTLPTVHYYCNQTLAHFDLKPVSIEDCRSLCRLSIAEFYNKLLRLGGCPEALVEKLAGPAGEYDLSIYLADYKHLTEPYPGMAALLQALKEKETVLAVLTNKPAAVAQSLIAALFPGVFDLVRGQTPHTISKPDPRSLLELLADLGVAREDCVYVGDTDVDMQTACNAHVCAAAVAWGYQAAEALMEYRPALIANSPEELLSLF